MYKGDAPVRVSRLSHSELAMRAAKGMGRSRHKERTGHIVCRHLLKMLEAPPAGPTSRTSARASGKDAEGNRQYSLGL